MRMHVWHQGQRRKSEFRGARLIGTASSLGFPLAAEIASGVPRPLRYFSEGIATE